MADTAAQDSPVDLPAPEEKTIATAHAIEASEIDKRDDKLSKNESANDPESNDSETQDIEKKTADATTTDTNGASKKVEESEKPLGNEPQANSGTNGAGAQNEDEKTETTPEKKPHTRHNDRDSKRNDQHGDRRTSYKGKNSRGGRYGNKFDPSSAKETNDPVEIRKQVEFYFSDSNLPNDKFLFEAIGGSKNKPVLIETIHNFKRMRRFQPFSAVVEALKESSTLDVVEDDTALQRKVPLPEGTDSTQPEIQKVFEDIIMSRSVYAKGFGREEPSTQFDIEAWFSKYGATNQVRLRRTGDSSFKGSVFVEFDSEDTATSFLSLDPKPKYNGKELMIKSKKQYCDEKVDDINAGAIRAQDPDERDWKARRENDRKKGFPALHKDGRDGRNHRGGNSKGGRGRGGRGGRGHNERDDGTRGRRSRDDPDDDNDRDTKSGDDEKVERKGSTDVSDEKAGESVANPEKKDDESGDTKKREREDEKEDDAPAAKKSAIESEMTGGPEAVEKKADE